MNIRFIGKHIDVTDGMRDHLQEKLVRYEKYAPRLIECQVVVKKEKYVFEAEITLRSKNLRAYGVGRSKENIFTAMDDAYLKVEKQLKKFREKIKEHHTGKPRTKGSVLNREEEMEEPVARPSIIPQKKAVRVMSVEEASLALEAAGNSFLAFQNSENRQINVIYKRDDGNHGLIDPDI